MLPLKPNYYGFDNIGVEVLPMQLYVMFMQSVMPEFAFLGYDKVSCLYRESELKKTWGLILSFLIHKYLI